MARALRAEGLAQQGQILVLGAPGRIVLLGSVSSLEDKRQAGRITRQVAGVRRVQNRIRISRDRSRANDTQLQWQLRERLRRLDPELADNVHVQAQTGKVILSGPVRDWRDLADVIEAAFAVGAESVVSRLEAGPAGQHLRDMGEPARTRRERSHRSPSPRADTFQYGTTRREGTDAGQYARPQRQPRDGRYGTRGTRGPRRSTQPRRAPGRRPTVLEGSQWYDLESNAQYEFTREPGRPTEEPQRRPRPRRTPQRFGNGAPPSSPERMMARERPSAQGYYPPYGYERDDSDRRPSDRPTRPRQDRQGRYLADRQSPGRSTRRQRTALSQSALAGRVRNRLIETLSGAENVRVLPPGDVCVVVEGGDVTLVGSVGDSAQKRRAERAVRSLQGVDRVRNYLTIGGREDRTTSQRLATRGDSEQRARRQSPRRSLAAEVAEQLRRDLPRPRQIMVTADRGTVTLRGAVQTPQQKRIAEEIARGIYGVRKVRNQLNIGIETGEYPPLAYTDGRPSRTPRGN